MRRIQIFPRINISLVQKLVVRVKGLIKFRLSEFSKE